jgi:Uma2 family endonuclease
MATVPIPPTSSNEPQPAWEVALLFPYQGEWSEDDYLSLETNHLVELVDGKLEVLPMPEILHQEIVVFLFESLKRIVVGRNLGKVLLAPLPMRIRGRTYREPDVIFYSPEHIIQPEGKYLQGANLVIEVVSADAESHKRDYQSKRFDYEERRIPEYWIVDPQAELITVLALDGGEYREHGQFVRGQKATSLLLSDFSVEVSDVLDAGKLPS